MKLYNCDTGWTILPAHIIWSLNANKKISWENFQFSCLHHVRKVQKLYVVREKRKSAKSIPLRCTCVFLYGAKIFAPRLKINIECKHRKKECTKAMNIDRVYIARAKRMDIKCLRRVFYIFVKLDFRGQNAMTMRWRHGGVSCADGACLCEIRCKYVSTCTARLRICEWISKSLHSSI